MSKLTVDTLSNRIRGLADDAGPAQPITRDQAKVFAQKASGRARADLVEAAADAIIQPFDRNFDEIVDGRDGKLIAAAANDGTALTPLNRATMQRFLADLQQRDANKNGVATYGEIRDSLFDSLSKHDPDAGEKAESAAKVIVALLHGDDADAITLGDIQSLLDDAADKLGLP